MNNSSLKNKIIKISAVVGLFATAFIWGISFVFMKESLNAVTPFFLLAIRFTVATLFLLFVCLPRLKTINKKTLIRGGVLGVALFAAYVLQTVGCKYTTAGKNAFLTSVYVVLVPFLSAITFRKKINPLAYISAVLTIIGIGLISLGGESGFNFGDWMTLACSVFFALHIIFVSDFNETSDPFVLTLLQFAVSTLLLWACAFIFEPVPSKDIFNLEIVGNIVFLGIFPSGLAFLLQSLGEKHVNASATSVILSLESVFGALAGVIVLHETMSVPAIIGCVIILISVTLSQVEKNPFAKPNLK